MCLCVRERRKCGGSMRTQSSGCASAGSRAHLHDEVLLRVRPYRNAPRLSSDLHPRIHETEKANEEMGGCGTHHRCCDLTESPFCHALPFSRSPLLFHQAENGKKTTGHLCWPSTMEEWLRMTHPSAFLSSSVSYSLLLCFMARSSPMRRHLGAWYQGPAPTLWGRKEPAVCPRVRLQTLGVGGQV